MNKFSFSDGRVCEPAKPVQLSDLVQSHCPEGSDRIVAARSDGQVMDLSAEVQGEHQIEWVVSDDSDRTALEILRHSTSHVLAQAVRQLYGEQVRYTIGPALVDDFKYGFYYDFDLPEAISADDLGKIEKRMRKLAARKEPFQREEVPIDQACDEFRRLGQEYKLELLNDLKCDEGVETVSLYRHGDFLDLCRGPHLPHTGFVRAFKLQSVAGAYWRGDAANKMLTRIYGVAFYDEQSLERHLEKVAEAERRDHRVLGRELDLYSISELIGPGLILWHPKGAIIRNTIERFWYDEHLKRGYEIIYSPHIAHERIYETSGHLEAYSDMMYSPMDIDGQNYRVKPMNCPAHIQVFKSQTRSYRDLPIRYCELGTVYRYEPSGTLHGMLRVRGFTQDDAHVFCTVDQLADEVTDVLELVEFMMKTFGYTYSMFLSTRPEKSIGTEEQWEWSTAALREVLKRREVDYDVDEGAGVFYGPKIDVVLHDSLGREWQGPTIQVDLNLPQRFNCTYVGADNSEHQVVMVHRAALGSMERFVGGLVEHYAGAFPVWLAPVQVVVMAVSEKFNAYAESVNGRLLDASLRTDMDLSNDKIGAKIRRATMQKVPYMVIVGGREQDEGKISVRSRASGDEGMQELDAFIGRVRGQVDARTL